MIKYYLAAALFLAALPASAQDCPLSTTTNTILRQAPGSGFAQIGTIPAGTVVPISICFDRGTYCAVNTAAGNGFVSGDLVATPDGRTVKALETARWSKIDADEDGGPAPYDRCNIVVWGDSLSAGSFGPDLARLLGRDVSMQGVPGEDGRQIGLRMLADSRYDGRITVIWDRHSSGEDAGHYMAALAPLVAKARSSGTGFIVASDIPDLDGNDSATPEVDAAATARINDALKASYAANYLDLTTVLADPAMHTDGLHLSRAGMAAVAGAIATYIQQRGW